LAGRRAERFKRPLRVYGLIEIAIALYALLIPWLFRLVDLIYALVWQQLHPNFYLFSLWRFVLSGVTLLVPTTLMGATLPVLAAVLMRTRAFKSTSVTRLYTYNLCGAILGTIAAGFFLLPQWGLRRTIYAAAILNAVVGLVAIVLDQRTKAHVENADDAPAMATERETAVEKAPESTPLFNEGTIFWLSCAFVSGFVTISTQVAWTRVLTMVIGSSTYAFSIVVALFLIGLSLGAYEISRKVRSGNLRRTIFKVEIATALALLLSLGVVNQIPGLLVRAGLNLNVGTWGALLALQIICAALLILLPAILMGAVMPLVLVWASDTVSGISVRLVGRTYAVNTLGAILGAFCTGFILIPRTGTRFTILLAAALCFLIAGLAFPAIYPARDRDVVRAFAVGGVVVLVLVSFFAAPRLNLNELSIGAYDSLVRVLAKSREQGSESEAAKPTAGRHELLMYEEGPTSTVSVRRDWDITALAINGRTNASDGEDMTTQVMLAQLPILLAPSIKNGLIVGFASGVSAGAILQSPIESVTCVELEPATVAASHFFEHVNNHPLNDPRLHLVIDDARTYLRGSPERYDLIMSEPSHPWVPGVANLFTEEFFQLGRQRLNDAGVFVQWLQVYQLSNESLRSVLATFQKVFPHVMVFRVGGTVQGKDLVLAGSRMPLNLDRIAERMREPRILAELSRVGMKSEADVRAWYVCDETRLAPATSGAVINTDDNMHVETTAPREAFLPLRQTNEAWIESLVQRK
ncbi:MAG: fused MFS/spermidine synthase, partial [Acidobacteriota bacterium]|nr:fused MFS/spermidine synthase [Acidobacteriota bacterium]